MIEELAYIFGIEPEEVEELLDEYNVEPEEVMPAKVLSPKKK